VKAKSVFLLVGDEDFLKSEWLNRTKKNFFKGSKENCVDYNQFFVDNSGSLPEIISVAKTRPFISNKRFIIARSIEKITSASAREQLLAYAKSPSPDTVLVLELNIRQKDFLGNKYFAELGKFSEVVLFKKLYDRNLANWITKQFIAREKKIEPKAVGLLIQLKGNDLMALDKEIEKLCLYAGARDTVLLKDCELLVGEDIENTVYEMMNAISSTNKDRALALSIDLKKKDMAGIVSLFSWNLRRLLRAKEYLKKGWTRQKISASLGINRYHVERFISNTKTLKASWIKKALSELTEFDLKAKSSGLSDSALEWQMLLVRLLAAL